MPGGRLPSAWCLLWAVEGPGAPSESASRRCCIVHYCTGLAAEPSGEWLQGSCPAGPHQKAGFPKRFFEFEPWKYQPRGRTPITWPCKHLYAHACIACMLTAPTKLTLIVYTQLAISWVLNLSYTLRLWRSVVWRPWIAIYSEVSI